MATNVSPVMSIAEFAETFHVSNAIAFRLARRKELPVPTIFIGERRMCVSRAAVEALLGATTPSKQSADVEVEKVNGNNPKSLNQPPTGGANA